jgi:hypothetical protein
MRGALTHLCQPQAYVYDESKTDIDDLRSMASKLLSLLEALGILSRSIPPSLTKNCHLMMRGCPLRCAGSIRNLSRRQAAFLYRLSCLETGVEELGLPFSEVVERVFRIAIATWKVRRHCRSRLR